MKKIYLTMLAAGVALTAMPQVRQHTPGHARVDQSPMTPAWTPHKPADQNGTAKSTSVLLGQAQNIYTCLLDGQNQVTYNPDIDALAFIHRQNSANHGGVGGSGTLRFDASTDGGATWTVDNLIAPNMFNGTAGDATGNRYPSCAIYNPPGNTDPTNAWVVGNGSALSSTTGSWGLLFRGEAPIDGSTAMDYYVDQFGDLTNFHPYGMSVLPNGDIFSFSTRYNPGSTVLDSLTYRQFQINKAVYNSGTMSFDWTVVADIIPDLLQYDDGSINNVVSDWNMAFSPDGMTGYAVVSGREATGPVQGSYPIIYKSTDGGATWSQLPSHDFSGMQVMIDNIQAADGGNGPVMPYFGSIDCAVDNNGTLHMNVEMLSGFSSNPDSASFIYADIATTFVFHAATADGVNWAVRKLSDIFNEDYEIPSPQPPGPSQSTRVQCTRTPDGSKVFFSWNSAGAAEPDLAAPDVYAVGYDPSTDLYTNVKNLTENSDAEFTAFFHTVSNICISGGDDFMYELPIVYAEPGADDLSPAQFRYLKGVGFDDAEFVVGINETNIADQITVFPNPSTGQFIVNLNDLGTVNIMVTDMAGRVVREERIRTAQYVLDLNGNAPGIYLLNLRNENGVATTKLVIE